LPPQGKDEEMGEAKTEKVDHPQHYKPGTYEVINVIEAYELGFHLGNTIKYVLRAGNKPGEPSIDDLKKARWYLDRKIEQIEKESAK
jgi:hypothetical protein